MDLLKCPRCGEEYSPSYRRCPFCEEGDHPRKIKYNSSKQSGGRRVSDKKQTPVRPRRGGGGARRRAAAFELVALW